MWILAVYDLILIILGIVFLRGKGSFLIAGYNTLTPQEKAHWDERALCRTVGILMFACAACFTVIWLSLWFRNYILLAVGIASLIIAVFGCGIYVNTSKKFKRK